MPHEERLSEGFINQGLGVSGLSRRAIQQSNLPRLQQALAQVSSVRARQDLELEKNKQVGDIEARRKAEADAATARAKQLKDLRDRLEAVKTKPDEFDPTKPQAVITGGRERGQEVFGITTRQGATGTPQVQKFNTLQDLVRNLSNIRKRGLQVVLPGDQEISTESIQALQKQGVFQRSDLATLQSFLGQNQRRGIFG